MTLDELREADAALEVQARKQKRSQKKPGMFGKLKKRLPWG